MPKIGLDIDEVLCDWIGGWMAYYNIKEVPTAWYWDRKIGERFAEMKEAGTLNSFYAGLKPLLKAVSMDLKLIFSMEQQNRKTEKEF